MQTQHIGKNAIKKNLTPLKAIRAKCLDCAAEQPSEARNCMIYECSLFSYRFGKNPNRASKGNLKGGFGTKYPTQLTIS